MPRTISMNWIDWITVALILVSAVRGARFGFWVVIMDVIAVVVTFLAASALYAEGGTIVAQYLLFVPAQWAGLIAFVVVWVVIYFPVSRIIRILLRDLPFPVTEITGGILGAARGFVASAAILVVCLAAPFGSTVARDAQVSLAAPYLLSLDDSATKLYPKLPVHVPEIGPGKPF